MCFLTSLFARDGLFTATVTTKDYHGIAETGGCWRWNSPEYSQYLLQNTRNISYKARYRMSLVYSKSDLCGASDTCVPHIQYWHWWSPGNERSLLAKNIPAWARINSLRPRQNGRQFPEDIFKCILVNENLWIPIKFHWSLFPRVQLTIFQHWFTQWLGTDHATSHYLNQWW